MNYVPCGDSLNVSKMETKAELSQGSLAEENTARGLNGVTLKVIKL